MQKPWADIPYEEFKRRREKAKELMESHGIDALLLFSQDNLPYYTGYRPTWHMTFYRGVVYPREGEPVWIAPGEQKGAITNLGWVENVISMPEPPTPEQDPMKETIKQIKELGLINKVIGLELGIGMTIETCSFSQLETIKKGLPNVKFVDATDMIWEQRMIKTPWEIETMRHICKVAVKGYTAGLEALREGMSELEFQRICWETWIREEPQILASPIEGGILMRAGPERYDISNSRAVNHKMKRGDVLFFDGGPGYKGYMIDFQRTAVIGAPWDKLKYWHKTAIVGYNAAREIIEPGTKISDLFHKPVKAMKEFNPEWREVIAFTGHSIGLNIHEKPWLHAKAKEVLTPGMVFNVETPGYWYVGPPWRLKLLAAMPEDTFLVTEDGYECFTDDLSRELWVAK